MDDSYLARLRGFRRHLSYKNCTSGAWWSLFMFIRIYIGRTIGLYQRRIGGTMKGERSDLFGCGPYLAFILPPSSKDHRHKCGRHRKHTYSQQSTLIPYKVHIKLAKWQTIELQRQLEKVRASRSEGGRSIQWRLWRLNDAPLQDV